MIGQFSLFGNVGSLPCQYKFDRYIGQKDCKFWVKGKTTLNSPNPYICDFHSFMHGFERSVLPEDYCSFVERKTE